MCAAPGSKTTQLLEIVSQSWARTSDGTTSTHSGGSVIEESDMFKSQEEQRQEGLVVANDSDTNR